MIKATCLLLIIGFTTSSGNGTTLGTECDLQSISSVCGLNQRCLFTTQTTAHCSCIQGSKEFDGQCVVMSTTTPAPTNASNRQTNDDTTSSSGSSVAVGILILTFLVVLGGLGFCCAKRYRLLPYRQNLYGNVLVTRDEDDDDDPPIA